MTYYIHTYIIRYTDDILHTYIHTSSGTQMTYYIHTYIIRYPDDILHPYIHHQVPR